MNKTEADLYKYVGKCLEEHNLDYTKDGDYFNVNTRFGKWTIRPEHTNRNKLVTIYTRFENAESIDKTIFREFSYNGFSGKLNFHYLNKDKEFLLMDFNYLCDIVTKKMTFEDFLNKLSDGNTFEDICDEYGHATCMVECIGNEVYFDDDLVGFLEEVLGAYIKEFRHGYATIETTGGKYYEIPYEKRQNRFDELEKEIILFFNSNEIKNI